MSSSAATTATTNNNKAQHLRPSYPSSRRDSNILQDAGGHTSLSDKSRSLAGTQTSSVASSPTLHGTDHEDNDEHDENDARGSNPATSGGGSASPPPSGDAKGAARPHFKEGIRLAEMGKWGTLVVRLQKEPQLARHKDHHGMLPLHWACTEDDVPPSVVQALLKASPEAVLTKNNAQYLPLHIAVRARVGQETLRMLCQARPSSLLETTPSGKTALMLAQEVGLPPESMDVLRAAEQAYLDLTVDRESASNDFEDAKREIAAQSQRLRESMMMPRPSQPQGGATAGAAGAQQFPAQRGLAAGGHRNTMTVSTSSSGTTFISIPNVPDAGGAPQSRNSGTCARASTASNGNQSGVDMYSEQLLSFDQYQFNTAPSRKFSVFRKKYQCKGCAVYLCSKHVAGKVMLPQYPKKRSACGDCYRIYRSDPMPNIGGGGAALATAPAAVGGRAPSFASSSTTNTTIASARTGADRDLSLRHTSTSVSSTTQANRTTRAASTQSLGGRPSTVQGPQLNARYSVNSAATRPRMGTGTLGGTNLYGTRSSSTVDRFGSESMMSTTESEPNASAEIAGLQQRIASLEETNKTLLTRLADQEKQYGEAMLLLTETMTRVAELEIKLPSMGLKGMFGTSTTASETRESNILGDYDFDFPTPFNEKFD
ncbi:hypothetical protein PybrP1_001693 [[Pythium] brassicae (nom. inval.)]|nr:hypothetical protein PybrP1_001693 [[Pythium] brassicae (nom. inval.)]